LVLCRRWTPATAPVSPGRTSRMIPTLTSLPAGFGYASERSLSDPLAAPAGAVYRGFRGLGRCANGAGTSAHDIRTRGDLSSPVSVESAPMPVDDQSREVVGLDPVIRAARKHRDPEPDSRLKLGIDPLYREQELVSNACLTATSRRYSSTANDSTNRMRKRIASPANVPETSSVASPSVLPLPHRSSAERQLLF
jgi:hypothetical protein